MQIRIQTLICQSADNFSLFFLSILYLLICELELFVDITPNNSWPANSAHFLLIRIHLYLYGILIILYSSIANMHHHSTTEQSTIKKDQPYYLKSINTHSQKKLNSSSISATSLKNSKTFLDNGVKLSASYYNDQQNIYVKRSRLLSEKSLSYQSKQISFSERRKYNENKIESIVSSRTTKADNNRTLSHKTMSLPSMNSIQKEVLRTRISSLNAKKFTQLIHGSNITEQKIKLLKKDVSQKRQEINREVKWMSPFRDTNTFKLKFEGKNLIPKRVTGIIANSNPNQLKVLNLDRMFRVKNGKLGNVVPLPVAKLSSISSRDQLVKSIKKKDTIHEIIEEYNKMLKIAKMQKTTKKIGIRGHNFTKSPTLEELMGIKVHQLHKKKQVRVEQEQIDDEVFLMYNQFYQKQMKKDVHLARRLMMGIKQGGKFNLQAYTRFYAIFVNKVTTMAEKIKFLAYFFIPHNQEKIELGVLKLILELMCEQLPQINSLKAQSQFLTKQEKSKIFLEALNRVLFADLKQFTGDGQVLINRNILEVLLQRNEDAVSLLIRLLLIQ